MKWKAALVRLVQKGRRALAAVVAAIVITVGSVLAPPALPVSADAISITAYTDVLGDVTDTLAATLPGIATNALAVGIGIMVLALGYRIIRRFVR